MATPSMNLGTIEPLMVHLPSPPAWPAPSLPPDAAIWWTPVDSAVTNMVEAAQNYVSDLPVVLSFRKGDLGVLVKTDTNGWLGLKIGENIGWVPSQYWMAHQPKPNKPRRKIKNIKQAEALHENQSCFLGKISEKHTEELLLKHGQQREFLIRDNTSQEGELALSVRYRDKVRHFPIKMTDAGKYEIGKAHFTDLMKLVSYYQNNPLFFDEQDDDAPVSLGAPINQPKTT